jgi:hypothetical protein
MLIFENATALTLVADTRLASVCCAAVLFRVENGSISYLASLPRTALTGLIVSNPPPRCRLHVLHRLAHPFSDWRVHVAAMQQSCGARQDRLALLLASGGPIFSAGEAPWHRHLEFVI